MLFSAMVPARLDIAGRAGVRVIGAQTLPENNVSTRILEKLGFGKTGSAIHPDDGEVLSAREGPGSDSTAKYATAEDG